MNIINQFRSIIQWENPSETELFSRFTDKGDEIKNASKLIILPGQGCIFTYEGKIQDAFSEPGMYDLKTDNTPFWTTIKSFMNAFESKHKVGIWFFRTAEILNMRWGTRVPIAYKDPIYQFPILLSAFGNYSIKITKPEAFFTNVIAGQEQYSTYELKEVFLSRITQPITDFLANSKFSFQEIDANLNAIANHSKEFTSEIFSNLGFQLLDFRIEGTQFDQETIDRINEISQVQADVTAAQIAGVDFAQLQQLKAMRDAAKNQGAVGAQFGIMMGANLSGTTQNQNSSTKEAVRTKLKELKELFDDELITEAEYLEKKKTIVDNL